MIPILYESTETKFVTNGFGRLSDATACLVTEERNGEYELEMEYPITGIHYSDLKEERIIFATPSDGADPQPFRIYEIRKMLNGMVDILAHHISYDLRQCVVMPFKATSISEAFSMIKSKIVGGTAFTFWTNKSTAAMMEQIVPMECRSLLGGITGSILDVYNGGDYEFDRFTVKLHESRGSDLGVTIRYSRDLTGLEAETDNDSIYTAVVPFWRNQDNVVTGSKVESEHAKDFPYQRCITKDFSSEFDEAPSVEQLNQLAKDFLAKNKPWEPRTSIDVEFIPLWQTEEYANVAPLQRIHLCDTVGVEYTDIGITVREKVIRTVYNTLLERYESIELGDARSTLAETITEDNVTQDELTETTHWVESSVHHATELLRGGLGGHVVLNTNADGEPEEILIMDTDNIATAKKIWRWNLGGLGYTNQGYNGTYGFAITQDGAIVADYITAGHMRADHIQGGTLTLGGKLNGVDNGNGVLRVLNSANTEVGRWDVNGIKAIAGTIGGWTLSNNALYNVTTDMNSKKVGTFIGQDGYRQYKDDNHFTNIENGVITANGAIITGSIYASSGTIGGFKINSDGISKGKISLTESKLTLGSFSVTSEGYMTATSGTFSGEIRGASGYFTGNVYAKNIQVGGDKGYVTGSQIGSGTVGQSNLNGSNVYGGYGGTGSLGTNSVTHDQLQSSSVQSDTIYDGSVGSSKLSDGSVNNNKLSSGNTYGGGGNQGSIGYNSVGTSQITDSAVNTGKIQNGSVTNGKIGDSQVTKGKMDTNLQNLIDSAIATYRANFSVGTLNVNNVATFQSSVKMAGGTVYAKTVTIDGTSMTVLTIR